MAWAFQDDQRMTKILTREIVRSRPHHLLLTLAPTSDRIADGAYRGPALKWMLLGELSSPRFLVLVFGTLRAKG